MKRCIWWGALVGAVVVASSTLVGCSSTNKEEELLVELANQDKQQIFDRAEELYADEKYTEARKYFSFIYDTFPNDVLGHKAALRVADTYAAKKDSASLTEARLRYRDFSNRYPNDPDRDYALMMLGNTFTAKKLRPDRELSSLEEAAAAYNQLVTLYPDSAFVEQARTRIAELRQVLAEHELHVAQFYARNRRWRGVTWRLEYLKEKYPDYGRMGEVDALLAEARAVTAQHDEIIAKFEEARKKAEVEAPPETPPEAPPEGPPETED